MIIMMTTGRLTLSDASNFKELKAVTPGASVPTTMPDGIRADPDGEHLWVATDVLRTAVAEQGIDAGAKFDAMVGFAIEHGFAQSDGSEVRVHLEAS